MDTLAAHDVANGDEANMANFYADVYRYNCVNQYAPAAKYGNANSNGYNDACCFRYLESDEYA